MTIELTEPERAFLRRLLQPSLDYYRTLSGSTHCTLENRQRWEQVRTLNEKFELNKSNETLHRLRR